MHTIVQANRRHIGENQRKVADVYGVYKAVLADHLSNLTAG